MPKDTAKETILAKYDELLQMGKKLEELPTTETRDTLAAPDIAVLKSHRDAQQIVYKQKETSRLVNENFSQNGGLKI